MQCMAGAMTTVAGASGFRAWLAAHRPRWLTPPRMRMVTLALLAAVLLSSALFVGGSAPPGT